LDKSEEGRAFSLAASHRQIKNEFSGPWRLCGEISILDKNDISPNYWNIESH
jgi:hypothetical protein